MKDSSETNFPNHFTISYDSKIEKFAKENILKYT